MRVNRSLIRSILREAMTEMLAEAPLAWGEDEETGEKKPSISGPVGEKERKELHDQLKDTELFDDYNTTGHRGEDVTYKQGVKLYGNEEEPYDVGQAIEGDYNSNFYYDDYEHDGEAAKKKDQVISDEYMKTYLRAGYVKRADKQFKRFPFDVHFVILPQFLGTDHFGGNANPGFYSGAGMLSVTDGDRYQSNSGKKVEKGIDANHFERFDIVENAPKLESFIKGYIKAKTGAIVKDTDIIFVNFVNFRYGANPGLSSEMDPEVNILNLDDETLKKDIKAKFLFADSLYMLMHTMFDGGPFAQRLTGLPGIFSILKMVIILTKYDSWFNRMVDNIHDMAGTHIGDWSEAEAILGDVDIRDFDSPDTLANNNPNWKKNEKPIRVIGTNKADTGSGLVFAKQEKSLRDIFKVKTIRQGSINTGFDFVSELCTVAVLNRIFPISIKGIANSIMSDEDKELMLTLLPGIEEVTSAAIELVDGLSGEMMIGSSTDQKNYDNV